MTAEERSAVEREIELHERIAELDEKRSRLVGEGAVLSTRPTQHIPTSILGDFDSILQQTLNAWQVPGVDHAEYDQYYAEIRAGGRTRAGRGKGVRSVLHSAFTTALARFCVDRDLHHLGFVVLDSPVVTYRDPEPDEIPDIPDVELLGTEISTPPHDDTRLPVRARPRYYADQRNAHDDRETMTYATNRIEALLDEGVRDKVYPGAVWAVGDSAGIRAQGTAGMLDPDEPDARMRFDTVFDAASLTKILAVWSSIGALWEDSALDLDAPLGTFWDEVTGHPLGATTARQLLTHTAGLPPRAQLKNLYGTDPGAIRDSVLHEALHRPPGEVVEYTDRAALILGYLAEHHSGKRLDQVAAERTWHPLGMNGTRFGPLSADLAPKCAPTELDQDTGTHLKGIAHDFSARLLGGVCGIAGTFTVADDLARFLRYMLAPSTAPADAGFGAGWTAYSLTVQTGDLEPARGLFWHPAPGTTDEQDVWVHYGFTGTGMWISPTKDQWAVLLTNKLYYTRDRQPLTDIRNSFRELAFG